MTTDPWSWLQDTCWYVPTRGLPAPELGADGTIRWMVDQTVWHITGARDGYLWGVAAVALTEQGAPWPTRGPRARATHLSLLATVTPSGACLFTFIPQGPGQTTTGTGRLRQTDSGWAFEMQMSTDRLRARLIHWADMLPIRPEDPDWDALPGVGLSVPDLLDGARYPTDPDPAAGAGGSGG